MTENNEQWVPGAGGECLKCRRHGYCKTQCKENKKMVYNHILRSFLNRIKEKKEAAAAAPEAEPAE